MVNQPKIGNVVNWKPKDKFDFIFLRHFSFIKYKYYKKRIRENSINLLANWQWIRFW